MPTVNSNPADSLWAFVTQLMEDTLPEPPPTVEPKPRLQLAPATNEALILRITDYTCTSCGTTISAPEPNLLYRYTVKDITHYQQLSKSNAGHMWPIRRELQRVELIIANCPSCFFPSEADHPQTELDLCPAHD